MWFKDKDGDLFNLKNFVSITSYGPCKTRGWTAHSDNSFAIYASIEEIEAFIKANTRQRKSLDELLKSMEGKEWDDESFPDHPNYKPKE